MRSTRVLLAFVACLALVRIPAAGAAGRSGSAALQTPRSSPAGSGTRADFNGDGYSDLAIGVSDEDVGTEYAAGAVNLIYGSSSGLSATAVPDQLWDQDSPDVEGIAEQDDHFGWALAAGDFNGDGYGDLAVSVPDEDVGAVSNAGAVNVIYGSPGGLSATTVPDQLWDEDSPGVPGAPETNDAFGQALAAGDFNADGFVDLAVSAPGKTVGTVESAGVVDILLGSAAGLSSTGARQWSQDSPRILEFAEFLDFFGQALAAGDLNGDGWADLAIGVPDESVGSVYRAGAMNVLYGSAAGIRAFGNQYFNQNYTGIVGQCEDNDQFAGALAAGDFDGDGIDDIAAGVRYESIGSVSNAGGVNVIYGSTSGLTSGGNQFWSQDSTGIKGAAETDDQFGAALAAGDFGNGPEADLAIGVPFEGGAAPNEGEVNVIYGSVSGLSSTGNQKWNQDTSGVKDTAEDTDVFGDAVGAGDFDGDGWADLAVGVPDEDLDSVSVPLAGAVNVLYGSSGGITAAGDQFWNQDTADVDGIAEPADHFGSPLASG